MPPKERLKKRRSYSLLICRTTKSRIPVYSLQMTNKPSTGLFVTFIEILSAFFSGYQKMQVPAVTSNSWKPRVIKIYCMKHKMFIWNRWISKYHHDLHLKSFWRMDRSCTKESSSSRMKIATNMPEWQNTDENTWMRYGGEAKKRIWLRDEKTDSTVSRTDRWCHPITMSFEALNVQLENLQNILHVEFIKPIPFLNLSFN